MAVAPPALRPSMPAISKSSPALGSLKRRSTLKRSIDDTNLMDIPSSPSKKSRVTFSPDVELLSADEEEDLDPVVIKEQVRRAIQRHLLHDNEVYERIRSIFAVSPDKKNAPSTGVLKIYLQAILANVSHLTRECSSLVHTILESEWIGRDEKYFTFFVKFLGNLAAAQGGYLNKIMSVLIELLGPQRTRRYPNTEPMRRQRIHRRVLQTCQYITQLIPTASGSLADKIAVKLDSELKKADDRMTYTTNIMDLIRYVPELTSDILTNVMRQLIKLDTIIQVDLDDEDDEAEDDILQHMSASQTLAASNSQAMLRSDLSDDDDLGTTDESDVEEEEDDDLDIAEERRRKLKENVKQVDMMMDMLFRYYTNLTTSPVSSTQHNAIEQLVAQFHSLILPTYRSRHPQFLIFHFAQRSPVIVDRFITSCISVLIDKRQSQVLRHAAAAYFSGFVGRGAHVSPSVVQDCLGLLCNQLNMLRKTYEPKCMGPDLKRYGDFYSIFQATMYIFCLRWRDIGSSTSDLEDEDDYPEEDDKKIEEYYFPDSLREALHSAIYSPLNPLRVCSPLIVEQFAKMTMMLQFLYVYPKLEENKRVRLATSWRAASDGTSIFAERDASWAGENGMLEGYFPYDPYHLPISKHWLEGDYVHWQGLPGEVEEDSDSDDEESDENDGELAELEIASDQVSE